jgi:hypothetical protein
MWPELHHEEEVGDGKDRNMAAGPGVDGLELERWAWRRSIRLTSNGSSRAEYHGQEQILLFLI